MRDLGAETIEELLGAVGDLLASDGESAALVVVGGATLNARGFVPRVTRDVKSAEVLEVDAERSLEAIR